MYIHKNYNNSSLNVTSTADSETQPQPQHIKRKPSFEKLHKPSKKSKKTIECRPSKEIKNNSDNMRNDISNIKKEIESFSNRKAFLFKNKLNTITSNLITIFHQYNDKYKNSKPSEERTKKLNEIISAKNALIEAIDEKIKTQKAFNHHINDLNQAKQNLEEITTNTIHNSQYSSYILNRKNNYGIIELPIILQNIGTVSIEIKANLKIIYDQYDEENQPEIIKDIENLLMTDIRGCTDKDALLEKLKKYLMLTNYICQLDYLTQKINKIDKILGEAFSTLNFDANQIKYDIENIKNNINNEKNLPKEDAYVLELFNDINHRIDNSLEELEELEELKNLKENSDKNKLEYDSNNPDTINQQDKYDIPEEEIIFFKKNSKLKNNIFQIKGIERDINAIINEAYGIPQFNKEKIRKDLRKIKVIINSKIRTSDDVRKKLFEKLNKDIYNLINNEFNIGNLNKYNENPTPESSKYYFKLIKIQIEIYNIFPENITIKDIENMLFFLKEININHIEKEDFQETKNALENTLLSKLNYK